MFHIHKSKTAKVVSGLAVFSMVLSLVGVTPASAATVEELTAQINSLLSTISSLQTQLTSLQGGSSSVPSFTFTTNLTMGSKGVDVTNLQKVLNSDPATQVAASGAGSKGNETTTFGALTKAAVIKFQNKYASEVLTPVGLSVGTGYVGAATRAKLNMMGGVVITPTPSVGSATVSTTVQPAASLAPTSANRVPFTKFVVTAGNSDVTINSVTVERDGLAQNAVFAGVVLLDDKGLQVGIAKTLNSNNQASIGEPVVVKAGTSRTFTVAGNMASSLGNYAGQVAGLKVVAVNSSSVVSGSLPITGAYHVINASLTLGTAAATHSSFDPSVNVSKEVGVSNFKFAGIRVTAGSAEKIRLWSIRWNQTGSVGSGDLGNVKVYVDGVAYDAVVSADGKYYTASFGSGIVIDKGLGKDIYVQADIIGSAAAGRTIQFDIYKAQDIYITGETYGYGITATQSESGTPAAANSQFTASTPFFDASKITVTAGTVTTVTKALSVPAQNIAVNVPNQVLGGFEIDLKGEPISVQSIAVTVASSSGSGTGVLTNVTLVDENGAVVAGPVDASTAGTTLTFSDTVTFPLGKHVYTIKGKVASTIGGGTQYTLSTTPSSQWSTVTGQTTGNTISLASLSTAATMNTMTVKSAALAVSVSPNPVAQFITAGAQAFTFANYQLDATASGEDVRFSTIPLLMDVTTMTTSEVSACQLFDGATALNTGSNVVSTPNDASDTSFTFDTSLTVTKGTIKTLALKCNIAGSVSDGDLIRWGITNAVGMTVTGVTSSNDVTETVTGSAGSLMTVAAGSFTVTRDSSSPSYTVVSAGTTGVTLGVLKFRAVNEALTLDTLRLQLTSTASSSAADLLGGTVTLWDGATQVGTAVFAGSGTIATSSTITGFVLPKDQDKILTIKGDISNQGTSEPGTLGALIKVDYDGACVSCTQAIGSGSGRVNSSSTSDTAMDGVRAFRSYPTFAKLSVPTTTLVTSTMDLYRFSVKAAASGSIGVYKFTVNIATSATPSGTASTTVTNLKVIAYTDSSFSNPVSGFTTAGQLNTTIAGLASSGNNDVTMTGSTQGQNYLQIPANTTYYFRVVADVALTGGPTAGSVTTNIQGDGGYGLFSEGTTNQLATAASTTAFATDNDFLWSPNSTSTSVTTTNDWTNGYFVPGLAGDNSDPVTLVK